MPIIVRDEHSRNEVEMILNSEMSEYEIAKELQRIYNTAVYAFAAQCEDDGKRGLSFLLPDETVSYGIFRLNGRRAKTFRITGDLKFTLRLQRIRCDTLQQSRTLFLDWMIPYCSLILSDAFQVLLETEELPEAAPESARERFGKGICATLKRKWTEWKSTVPALFHSLSLFKNGISMMSACLVHLSRTFLEPKGRLCEYIKLAISRPDC